MQRGGQFAAGNSPRLVGRAAPTLRGEQRPGGGRDDRIGHAGEPDQQARLLGAPDRGRQRVGDQVMADPRDQLLHQVAITQQPRSGQPQHRAPLCQDRLRARRLPGPRQQPRRLAPDIRLDRTDDPAHHMRQHQPGPFLQARIGSQEDVGDGLLQPFLGAQTCAFGTRHGTGTRQRGVTQGI